MKRDSIKNSTQQSSLKSIKQFTEKVINPSKSKGKLIRNKSHLRSVSSILPHLEQKSTHHSRQDIYNNSYLSI